MANVQRKIDMPIPRLTIIVDDRYSDGVRVSRSERIVRWHCQPQSTNKRLCTFSNSIIIGLHLSMRGRLHSGSWSGTSSHICERQGIPFSSYKVDIFRCCSSTQVGKVRSGAENTTHCSAHTWSDALKAAGLWLKANHTNSQRSLEWIWFIVNLSLQYCDLSLLHIKLDLGELNPQDCMQEERVLSMKAICIQANPEQWQPTHCHCPQ